MMNLNWEAQTSAQKITETTKSLKICYILTLIVIVIRSYLDKVKWHINSERAVLNRMLLNELASRVNIRHVCSCWRRTFWAHAVMKMMWC